MRKVQIALIFILLIVVALVFSSHVINPVNELLSKDTLTQCWSRLADLNKARSLHTVNVVNEKIYVIGGHNKQENSIEVFDMSLGSWAMVGYMKSYRVACSGCAVDGKIYMIGGHNIRSYNLVDVYDPVMNTWESKAPMLNHRTAPGTAAVEEKIYAIGGFSSQSQVGHEQNHNIKTIEEYNPYSDTWIIKSSMPVLHCVHPVVINYKICLPGGGEADPLVDHKEFLIYDPLCDTITVQ
jgi:N-acetylneuraminic acid mutarotase